VNVETNTEDLTILAAFEALGLGVDSSGLVPVPGADDSAETLTRLYLEALGLMPFALSPETPSPEVHARLLAAIQGEETQDLREPAQAPARSERAEEQAAVRPRKPGAGPSAGPPSRPRLVALPPQPGRPEMRRRWPLLLAASLAAVFAGLSGWLALQMQERQRTIADLRQELVLARQREESASAEVAKSQLDALDLKEKFALVTSPAVEVSPIRPVGGSPLQPAATGVLFVASNHQHWYLTLHNLAPAPGAKTYCLWFIDDKGIPLNAGALSVRPGSRVELSSRQMPAGVKAVAVSLEDDPRVAKPAGPVLLQGAAFVQL
jgi:hypothetical protein